MTQNNWIMAFDYGEHRIGVAIGNTALKIPHPAETIVGRNKFEKLDKIAKLIDKWQPSHIVVGMPTVSDDKEELLKSINRFANRLMNKFKLPVTFINEDYTSSIAVHKLNEQSIRGFAQKSKLDMLAACLILQYFFDSLENV